MKRIKDVRGMTALVTGADGGIGREFCRELARRGSNIIGVSNRGEALIACMEDIRKEFGVETLGIECNLASEGASEALFSDLKSRGKETDILINNAGIFSFRPVTELESRRIDLYVDLHVRSVTELTRLAALEMSKRGRGMILNMSSMSCWTPYPGIALYSATKAYIRAFSRAMHYELRDSGVSITVACPGGIATDLFGLPGNLKRLAVGIGAIETPERFARKCVRRMLARKKQYVNGFVNRLAIVGASVAPTCVRMLIKRKMLDKGIRVG